MYHSLWQLGCFKVLVITNKDAINICVCILLVLFFILSFPYSTFAWHFTLLPLYCRFYVNLVFLCYWKRLCSASISNFLDLLLYFFLVMFTTMVSWLLRFPGSVPLPYFSWDLFFPSSLLNCPRSFSSVWSFVLALVGRFQEFMDCSSSFRPNHRPEHLPAIRVGGKKSLSSFNRCSQSGLLPSILCQASCCFLLCSLARWDAENS